MIRTGAIVFALVTILPSLSAGADNRCIAVTDWTFEQANGDPVVKARPGLSLTDPAQGLRTAEGKYVSIVSKSQLSGLTNPALYIPAIGGLSWIQIGMQRAVIPVSDYASVGPVIPFGAPDSSVDTQIEIGIMGDKSSYAGLWKAAPVVCELLVATRLQNVSELWQRKVPSAIAIICVGLAILFAAIYFYTNRRFQFYKLFSFSLLLWTPFFILLSGTARQISYSIGTLALFPARLVAALGLLFLFNSYRGKNLTILDSVCVGSTVVLLVLAVVGAVLGSTSLQVLCLGSSILFQVPAVTRLLCAGKRKRDVIVAAMASVAFFGESFDFVKLAFSDVLLISKFPYLNRVTIPPILFLSAVYFLWHFVKYFRDSRLNEFRHRMLGRLALRLARSQLHEETLIKLSRSARRIHFARRASIARRQGDDSYRVVGLSGFDSAAVGKSIAVPQHPHISKAVNSGDLVVASVTPANRARYSGGYSLAVPIPLRPNPEYLLLVSDFRTDHQFSDSEMNVCRQFFTTLSTALIATQERAHREAREVEFQTLVKKLDPNLFEFIQRNVDHQRCTVDETCERGVIFFDQQAYTALLERIHPDLAAKALSHIKQWVSEHSFKFNARIKGFYGDAFIVEVYPLANEDRDRTAIRTIQIAWELNEGIDELNRKLVLESLPAINFRFGAHFGMAANVDVDLVSSGSTTLIGDAVNLAQRIQAHASPGSVLVSDRLAELAAKAFVFEAVAKKYVKGRSKLVFMHRLVAIRGTSKEVA